jgi:hypothetical protein
MDQRFAFVGGSAVVEFQQTGNVKNGVSLLAGCES